MTKLFLIPGLGADYRIYQNLDFQGYEVVFIKWLIPAKNDTLTTYSQKLIDEYQITAGSIVVGNSLGGMLAMEIAKKIKLNKAILISSIKTIDEAPKAFKWYRRIPLYKLVPAKMYTSSGLLIRLVMGKISRTHHELFIDMLKKTPPVFAKWAVGAILHWDNHIIPERIYHIHGDRDLMFPYQRIKDAEIVHKGSHLMVMNKSQEINNWLKNILPL